MSLTRSEIQSLESGATLLTATRYQADALRREYGRHCAESGFRAWSSPDILPYAAWLERSYRDLCADARPAPELAEAPILLSGAQQRALWSRIIHDSGFAGNGQRIPALVRQADAAWRLLQDWRIPLTALPAGVPQRNGADESVTETAVFATWARDFERACADAGWLDGARLGAWLLPHAGSLSSNPLPRGFVDEVPSRTALFAACGARVADIDLLTRANMPTSSLRQQACADALTEMVAAACWARQVLDKEPEAQVAIVIGDPRLPLPVAAHQLRRELAPQRVRSADPSGNDPFTMSQPLRLAEHPWVEQALDLLRLEVDDNPFDRIGALLTDPLLGAGNASARALFEAELRRRPLSRLSLGWLIREARRRPELADLEQALAAHLAELNRGPRRRSLLEWVAGFSRVLVAWRWPAHASGAERARFDAAWESLLDDLVSLDLVLPAQTRGAALGLLRDLVQRRRFGTEAPDAPLRLLSVEDAIDLRHEHVWVTGLHEQAWPQAGGPHPWLPLAAQRRFGLPQCDAAARLRLARAKLCGVLGGARSAVLSWPRRDGDAELQPTMMIRALPMPQPPIARRMPSDWLHVASSAQRELFDDPGPEPVGAAAPVRGGAALLDDQSACPFRAFARHRLRAESLEEPGPGLDPAGRGQAVHAALHACWRRLGTQRALLALDSAARRELLIECVDAAIEDLQGAWRLRFGARFVALERGRLVALLERWLTLEALREPFNVEATEHGATARIGDLTLRLRFDRVDQLESGGHLIIDYKTGPVVLGDWLGDRPKACQLPLYAVTAPAVAGIAYACVSRRTLAYKGLVAGAAQGPGLAPADAWDAQLVAWSTVLSDLADEYHRGLASVTPQPQACRYCRLDALCRIAQPSR